MTTLNFQEYLFRIFQPQFTIQTFILRLGYLWCNALTFDWQFDVKEHIFFVTHGLTHVDKACMQVGTVTNYEREIPAL